MLALTTLPSSGLEIGSVTVRSTQGEPLDAIARIYLDPGERFDNTCLSAGKQSDFPESDHILLTDDVRLRLQPDRESIRITTSKPVEQAAVSIAVRARCLQGPITVRALNLYLKPSSAPSPPAVDASLPGTVITIKPGDSVYGLSRIIYPHDEKAVRDLAQAIVLANPGLFPEGRARPLQVGEKLAIPDLRTVQRVVAGLDARHESPKAVRPSRVARSRQAAGTPPPEIGPLRLKLARSIDLSRSEGIDAQTRATLRSQAESAITGRTGDAGPSGDTLSSRINRLSEIQQEINARLARLESAATALRVAFEPERKQQSPPPSTAAPDAAPAKPVAIAPPPKPAIDDSTNPAWWKWIGIGAALILLAIGGVFLGRKLRTNQAMAKRRRRIEEMLEQARTEATPLLGPETVPAADRPEAARDGATGWDDAIDDTLDLQAQLNDTEPLLDVPAIDAALKAAPQATAPATPPPDTDEISSSLRREMSDSLDSTRSMFSDIDRFIALGRIQNAINLLEFQIERQPDDRPSWIKLMAVYRHHGMDDDFDRTFANFRERFGGS